MVRERLDDFWISRMYELFANEPELRDQVISDKMKVVADSLDRDDYPATRTVNKYRGVYHDMPENERVGYCDFHWPASMVSGLLPWEASEIALELLGAHRRHDAYKRRSEALKGMDITDAVELFMLGRPSLRLVRWHWQIAQAAPDLLPSPIPNEDNQPGYLRWDGPNRSDIAKAFAAREAMGNIPDWLRANTEDYLAYAPWRGLEYSMQYQLAIELRQVQELSLSDLMLRDLLTDLTTAEAIHDLFGRGYANQWEEETAFQTADKETTEDDDA